MGSAGLRSATDDPPSPAPRTPIARVRHPGSTTVILTDLSKSFLVEDVERKLTESVPLKAPDFAVYVNGHRLYPRSIVGRRIPLLEGTKYGPVTGEIIITPKSGADFKDLGIEVKVKGATVKKDLFGMETWGKAVARVKGERNHPSVLIWSIENEWLYINCINLYGGLMDQFEAETFKTAEAVKAADDIMPGVAVPMHYATIVGSDKDAETFKKLYKGESYIFKRRK